MKDASNLWRCCLVDSSPGRLCGRAVTLPVACATPAPARAVYAAAAALRLRVGGGDKVALKSDQARDVPQGPHFARLFPCRPCSSAVSESPGAAVSCKILVAMGRNCGSRLSFRPPGCLVTPRQQRPLAPHRAGGAPSVPPCPGLELTPNGASGALPLAARGPQSGPWPPAAGRGPRDLELTVVPTDLRRRLEVETQVRPPGHGRRRGGRWVLT